MLFDFFDPETALLDAPLQYKTDFNFTVPDNLTQHDRWLAASSLQKCIRRSDVHNALVAAHILKSINDQHLWNRLKVIALEDVGLADLDIVSQVLWVAGKREWRSKHYGNDLILDYLITRLCKSKGCRSLDDALYIADRHPLYAHQRMICSGMSENELRDLFFDESLDVIERVIVCWYLAGTRRYRAQNLTERKGDPNILLELAHSVMAPPYVLDVMRLSRCQEYIISLLPCIMQLEQSKSCAAVKEVHSDPVMIGHYCAPAYDRHTQKGKWSFRRFLQNCPEVSGFIQKHLPKADPVDLMGWAVFAVEGRLLSERMTFEGSECLLELAQQSWLLTGGMPVEMQEEFLNVVKKNMEKLHDARRQ